LVIAFNLGAFFHHDLVAFSYMLVKFSSSMIYVAH
jgi:hypothetical protein